MLKPLFDKHSIEAVTLLCEFTAELDKAGLDFIRGEAQLIQRKLPFRRVKRRGPQGTPAHDLTSGQPEVVGFMFLQKTLEEETETFEISGERASFTSKAYSTFESFFADSLFLLSKANEAFSFSGAKLKRVLIRYKDSFSSDSINWDPYTSLREDSPYLPKPIVQRGEFWHCEAGFFVPCTPPDILLNNYKIEHTVLLSDSDTDPVFLLKIHLFHLLESKSFSESEDFSRTLRTTVEKLRAEHKRIFHGILSDELAKRIGLSGQIQGA